MNYRALRRALARFQEPIEKAKRQCLARPPSPNSRQKCFEFGPDIKDHPNIHAICTLKRWHPGDHYDAEYDIQWDEKTAQSLRQREL